MRSNEDNFLHFCAKFGDTSKAEMYDESLFNIEKCLHYAEEGGFNLSYKCKASALYEKGVCLIHLNKYGEAKFAIL